jgi:RNA polymerase sigma-70 factor (ECF subfamily)
MTAPPDADLVHAARTGDANSLGLLVARHRAGMYAVAVSLLGYGPDAEDAVQDAALTALRRIGDVRDPDAVGPWLRAVVRNACRSRLRSATAHPVDHATLLSLPSTEPEPDEVLDGHAMRDWIWHAIGSLTPSLRLVTMLRYFTDVTDYQSIATACGIPVGTVRSRLSQARAKLGAALLDTADTAHDDVAALTRTRHREAEEVLGAVQNGSATAILDHCSPTISTYWPRGHRTDGTDYLIRSLSKDLTDGVRQRVANVVADRDTLIWEADLISPPDDPFHCPPGVVWIQTLRGGRVQELRLFHKARVG